MKNMKKKILFISLIVISIFVLFFIKSGYAYPKEKLTMNSSISIDGSGWNIYFSDVEKNNDNIYDINIDKDNNTKPMVSFHVDLLNPGDEYSFNVKVINNGNLDGIIESVELATLNELESKYLEYYVSYSDDVLINNGDLLKKQKSDNIKITIKYLNNSEVDYDNIVKDFDLFVKFSYASSEEHSQERIKDLSKNVKVGDVIRYKNVNETYNILSSLTGFESDQLFDLSNLYLWEVLQVNEDGSIVVISKYFSNSTINFTGATGYKNYVGVLNEVAGQYVDPNYIDSARAFGYSTQTQYLTDVNGGNDTLYNDDSNLVMRVLGGLLTTSNDGASGNYAVASRFYDNEFNNYGIRAVDSNGDIVDLELFDGEDVTVGVGFRPILVIKNGVMVSGDGVINSPYNFE